MALDDPQRTAALATAAADDDPLKIREDWTGPVPAYFLVRTIDLKEVPVAYGGQVVTELHAMFRDQTSVQPLPAQGITQAIKDIVRGGGPAPGLLFAAQPSTYAQTPLDLELLGGTPTYIILILGKPFNMRFNPDRKGVRHKELDDRQFYGGLRHVKVTATTYEESERGLDDCAIVYFVANPPAPPSVPPPPEYSYRHPFDLNVRLRQPDGADQKPRALDLVIDPDIRYPGQ
ncbi:MAG TPA: nucleotide synthetase [Allosphingosinicella sp.]|nr:nucleotide synthetase [Allosphingosinicella sp.]